jgi:hypothetical protein
LDLFGLQLADAAVDSSEPISKRPFLEALPIGRALFQGAE